MTHLEALCLPSTDSGYRKEAPYHLPAYDCGVGRSGLGVALRSRQGLALPMKRG